uniref:Uncharacterized protein n=1 Tax=Anguilla anguilla TaxID=7936 RepID=A0A0E9VXF2_ANGAN
MKRKANQNAIWKTTFFNQLNCEGTISMFSMFKNGKIIANNISVYEN